MFLVLCLLVFSFVLYIILHFARIPLLLDLLFLFVLLVFNPLTSILVLFLFFSCSFFCTSCSTCVLVILLLVILTSCLCASCTSFSSSSSSSLSSFLAHLSQRLIGELIGYSWSGVRPSSVVRRPSSVRRKQFQTSSSPKPLGRSKPNFMWSLLG